MKDVIVCGTNDNSLRERLLRESELTLPKAMSAGHAAEETRKHAREILQSNETINLHNISNKSNLRSGYRDNKKMLVLRKFSPLW